MPKYVARTCPRCRGFVGIVVNDPVRKEQVSHVYGFCVSCGYRVNWKLIPGKRGKRFIGSRYFRR